MSNVCFSRYWLSPFFIWTQKDKKNAVGISSVKEFLNSGFKGFVNFLMIWNKNFYFLTQSPKWFASYRQNTGNILEDISLWKTLISTNDHHLHKPRPKTSLFTSFRIWEQIYSVLFVYGPSASRPSMDLDHTTDDGKHGWCSWVLNLILLFSITWWQHKRVCIPSVFLARLNFPDSPTGINESVVLDRCEMTKSLTILWC